MNLVSLLKYWQPIVAAILSAAFVAVVGFVLHDVSMSRATAKYKNDLQAAQESLKADCQKDKQITTEVSHDYQTQIAGLHDQLAAAKRLRPSACIAVRPAQPAAGRDAAPVDGELSNPYAGVNSDDLLDFAFDAEEVGRRLDACQSFIRKVYDAKSPH